MAAEYFALCTLIGFAIAIVLIIRKVAPACCLIHAGAAVLYFLPNGSLCIARKSDEIRARFFRKMPQTYCAVLPYIVCAYLMALPGHKAN